MGFQAQVNQYQAPAVAGDFASSNPRILPLAGPNGIVAGVGGCTVGKFAWLDPAGDLAYSHAVKAGVPAGFVHRETQAQIADFTAGSGNNIPVGQPVSLFAKGDFWALNSGSGTFSPGDQVYATYATGDVATAAVASASATGSVGATMTATGTGTSFVVTAVTGKIYVGDTLVATTGIDAGITIVAQVSGTTNGAGTYTTSAATTINAATATTCGSLLTVTAVSSGTLEVGESITGTGMATGAAIVSQVSGTTGGVGVYVLSVPTTAYAASTTIASVGGVSATGWLAKSAAAMGELVKISNLY